MTLNMDILTWCMLNYKSLNKLQIAKITSGIQQKALSYMTETSHQVFVMGASSDDFQEQMEMTPNFQETRGTKRKIYLKNKKYQELKM